MIYELRNQHASARIVGAAPLDLRRAVQRALADLPHAALEKPQDEILLALVELLCTQTGYRLLEPAESFDVETLYWAEVQARNPVHTTWRRP